MHRRAVRGPTAGGLGIAALALVTVLSATPAAATPPEGSIRNAGGVGAAAGRYIVVLKDGTAAAAHGAGLAARYGGTAGSLYRHALKGFALAATPRQARRLAADPAVAYVEQDRLVTTDTENQGGLALWGLWGLDRIDQRDRPLNDFYRYDTVASNVTAFVIDTGIFTGHRQFTGRATVGIDVVGGTGGQDCNGHGTHVAGIIGGAGFGVAKAVKLVAVRVLGCDGRGRLSDVIAGVDWVTGNAVRPSVVNMSLSSPVPSDALDAAVNNSINANLVYAVAAGNTFGGDSCGLSPSRVPNAITVAASGIADDRPSFTSIGPCVDLFAPGVDISSAAITGDLDRTVLSGTSMASPHVAGAAALMLSANPSLTSRQVHDTIVANASLGRIVDPGPATTNRLLFTNPAPTPTGPPTTRALTVCDHDFRYLAMDMWRVRDWEPGDCSNGLPPADAIGIGQSRNDAGTGGEARCTPTQGWHYNHPTVDFTTSGRVTCAYLRTSSGSPQPRPPMTLCRHTFTAPTHTVTNVWNWQPGDCSHGLPAPGSRAVGQGNNGNGTEGQAFCLPHQGWHFNHQQNGATSGTVTCLFLAPVQVPDPDATLCGFTVPTPGDGWYTHPWQPGDCSNGLPQTGAWASVGQGRNGNGTNGMVHCLTGEGQHYNHPRPDVTGPTSREAYCLFVRTR